MLFSLSLICKPSCHRIAWTTSPFLFSISIVLSPSSAPVLVIGWVMPFSVLVAYGLLSIGLSSPWLRYSGFQWPMPPSSQLLYLVISHPPPPSDSPSTTPSLCLRSVLSSCPLCSHSPFSLYFQFVNVFVDSLYIP
jgi:hypothetical protein